MREDSRETAASRPGKRARRKVLTRQELLLAGRRLFSEKGLYECRVEDLARTAGIAKGTLYLYFRDKEHLIQAVVAAGFGDLAGRVRERTVGARSPADVATRTVAAHMEFFAENPDLMRIFHQARGMLKFDQPRWRSLRVPLLRHLECIAEILQQSPMLARLSPARRRDLAIQLFGMVSGVSSVRVAARPGAPVGADTPDLARAVVAAVATRPSRVGGRRRRTRLRDEKARGPRSARGAA